MREKEEDERLKKLEEERAERERVERERKEAERVEKERLEKERLERERIEREKLEAERLEAERLKAEKIERERLERERIEKERIEAEERKRRLEEERRELKKKRENMKMTDYNECVASFKKAFSGHLFKRSKLLNLKTDISEKLAIKRINTDADFIYPSATEFISGGKLNYHNENIKRIEENKIFEKCVKTWCPHCATLLKWVESKSREGCSYIEGVSFNGKHFHYRCFEEFEQR